MNSRSRSASPYLVAAAVLLTALYVDADECSQQNSNGISSGDVLNISGVSSSDIGTAITTWFSGCSGFGISFPSMVEGGSGGIPVVVTHHSGTSTLASGSCGRTVFTLQGPSNSVISASVDLWDRQANGVDCNTADTLAHELGHVLGLQDVPTDACKGRIMGERPLGGTRSVGADDCTVAGQKWSTTTETDREGGEGGTGGCLPV